MLPENNEQRTEIINLIDHKTMRQDMILIENKKEFKLLKNALNICIKWLYILWKDTNFLRNETYLGIYCNIETFIFM